MKLLFSSLSALVKYYYPIMSNKSHARTHARTHSCTHARTHARTHAHTHARTHTRTHIRTPARMHARTQTRADVCTHARTHVRKHARTHAHTQRMHTGTHSRTRTHISASTHDTTATPSHNYKGLLPVSDRLIITLHHTNPHYVLSMTTTLSNVMFSCSICMFIIQNN